MNKPEFKFDRASIKHVGDVFHQPLSPVGKYYVTSEHNGGAVYMSVIHFLNFCIITIL